MARWYCMIDNEKQGPFSTSQLRQLAAQGRLAPEDLITRDGLDGWVRASRTKGLFDVVVAPLAERAPGEDTLTPTQTDARTAPNDTASDPDASAEHGGGRNRRTLVIAGLGGVVLVAAITGGIFWWMNRPAGGDQPTQSTSPEAEEKGISWPAGSGYLTEPKNRPDTPHDVKQTISRSEIVAVKGRTLLFGKNSRVEYRAGKSMAFSVGAQTTYLCKSPTTLEWPDYNGDKCVLAYGLTVRVDEYGQFVPESMRPAAKTDGSIASTPTKKPAKAPVSRAPQNLKARTITPGPPGRRAGASFTLPGKGETPSRETQAHLQSILDAYRNTLTPERQYYSANRGTVFEVTDGTHVYRAQVRTFLGNVREKGINCMVVMRNEWVLPDGTRLPAHSVVRSNIRGPDRWHVWRSDAAARPPQIARPDKEYPKVTPSPALADLRARTLSTPPSTYKRPIRLGAEEGLSAQAGADIWKILDAYTETLKPASPSAMHVSAKHGAVFEVTDGNQIYRAGVGNLSRSLRDKTMRFSCSEIQTRNEWVLPDGTRLPAGSRLRAYYSKPWRVWRPLAVGPTPPIARPDKPKPGPAPGQKPAKSGDEAWRTDIGAFTRKVAEVAKRSHIPDRRQLMDSIRDRKVFTNSAGKPILVVLKPLLDGELHGGLAKAFTGKIAWSGRVETIEKAKDGKTYKMEIAWPIPKNLPKNVKLRSKLLMHVSAGVLEGAGVPKKGQDFSFIGELKKDKPDGGEPVWVYYSLDLSKGTHLVGATPINVKPVQ